MAGGCWWLIPLDEAEVKLDTGAGTVDYDLLKQALLGSIASKTGYPKAGFEGIEMERQGGSFNEERLMDCERVIQRQYKDIAKWLVLRFAEYYTDWGVNEENYKMRYVRREIGDERQQAEIDESRARRDKELVAAGIKSRDECRPEWGLEGPAPEPPNQFGINVKGLNPEQDNKPPTEDDKE
jgi:hypothetical protein